MPSTTSNSHTADLPLQQKRQALYRRWQNPWLLQLFFWRRLPTLGWWGVRVVSADDAHASISIPFSWRTQNPFRSIYFAALAGTAELSTGLLLTAATTGRGPISMLVVENQATFRKKANATITFTCTQGSAMRAAVDEAIRSRQPQTVTAETIGRLPDGQEAARMQFTWSILAKEKSA